eukprot:scaffold458_cov169-Ochromonas_danica.AAC.2
MTRSYLVVARDAVETSSVNEEHEQVSRAAATASTKHLQLQLRDVPHWHSSSCSSIACWSEGGAVHLAVMQRGGLEWREALHLHHCQAAVVVVIIAQG